MRNTKKVSLGKDTKDYLKTNEDRGLGNGLTISSWVGKYKGYSRWSWKYTSTIAYQLHENPTKAIRFVSCKGGIAFYPTTILKGENKKKYKTILTIAKLDPSINIHALTKELFKESG